MSRAVFAVVTSAALAACSGGGDDARVAAAANDFGLQLIGEQVLGPRLVELTLRTQYLDEDTGVRVLLPAGYADSERRYPVLFLLNGALDDHTSWTGKGDAVAITDGYPLIVVMPSGGADGEYSDHWNFGAFGNPRWESYHMRQLVPWVDAQWRTLGTRDGRAIAGLSMGGGGAMKYAARFPQLFGAAAAFSGAVDTNYPPVMGTPDYPTSGRIPMSVWGPRPTEEVRWRGNNAWDLADNLRGMALFLRSHNGLPGNGQTGDPIEATVYRQSVNLHQKLSSLGIAHRWHDSGAGSHQWSNWNEDLRQTLPALMEAFARPTAAPSPFTFTAIENSYEAYGWRVELQRPVLEFSRLEDASASGFMLRGSGDAVVTTAALFAANRAYAVQVGDEPRSLTADREGRLQIALTLGPANPFQQYTIPAQAAGTQVYAVTVSIAP